MPYSLRKGITTALSIACSTMPVAGQLLCGGTADEKIEAIFDLFDRGEGGGITRRDLATYISSTFRVMYKLQPGLEEEVTSIPLPPYFEGLFIAEWQHHGRTTLPPFELLPLSNMARSCTAPVIGAAHGSAS